ncbi:MAG: hypothetical protein ACREP1_03935, partial [Rhodanobacteraceae bacterium]
MWVCVAVACAGIALAGGIYLEFLRPARPSFTTVAALKACTRQTQFHLEALVTYADRGKRLYVQDETGALALLNARMGRFRFGDQIVIDGNFDPGRMNRASGIDARSFGITLTGARQEPGVQPITLTKLHDSLPDPNATPPDDGSVLEVEGILRANAADRNPCMLRIASEGIEMPFLLGRGLCRSATSFSDARVRAHAVLLVTRGARPQPELIAAGNRALQIEEKPVSAPRLLPSIYELIRHPQMAWFAHLIRIRGVVIAEGKAPGSGAKVVVLDDGSGSIPVELAGNPAIAAGTRVEAEGWPTLCTHSVVIQDAVIKPLPPAPAKIRALPSGCARLLTSAAAVHALTARQASRACPVHLNAVVTYADRSREFFMVQDQTSGIYVHAVDSLPFPSVGDRVDLRGFTGPGGFAPIIVQPRVRILGRGTLPHPAPRRTTHRRCRRTFSGNRVRCARAQVIAVSRFQTPLPRIARFAMCPARAAATPTSTG